jgi:hypothetical protein
VLVAPVAAALVELLLGVPLVLTDCTAPWALVTVVVTVPLALLTEVVVVLLLLEPPPPPPPLALAAPPVDDVDEVEDVDVDADVAEDAEAAVVDVVGRAAAAPLIALMFMNASMRQR